MYYADKYIYVHIICQSRNYTH